MRASPGDTQSATLADAGAAEPQMSKALALESWALAALPITPLLQATSRTLAPSTQINSLKFSRSGDEPGEVMIDLQAADARRSEYDGISDSLAGLGYLGRLATVEERNGSLSYRATLERRVADPRELRAETPASKFAVTESTPESAQEDVLDYANTLLPYFARTDEAPLVETGISLKLKDSALNVPFRSFKVAGTEGARWAKHIPSVVRAELVVEDEWDKTLQWLESMERIKPHYAHIQRVRCAHSRP